MPDIEKKPKRAVRKKPDETSIQTVVADQKSTTEAVTVTPVRKDDEPHQRIRIKIRAYDHKIIDQSTRTIIETAQRSGAKTVGPIPLPTEKSLYTVNRSTFVHKDAREQFEMRIHKRMIDIVDPSGKTIDALTSLSLPAGVDIEIKM